MFSSFRLKKRFLPLLACTAIFQAFGAFAAEKGVVNIRQVQVGAGSRVDLMLDGRITDRQIRTEYLNDIIQLSVSDASVYPAKITSVTGQDITKVFVYQYAPRLVRVRLTVKGRADSYKGKLAIQSGTKSLGITLGGSRADQLASNSSQAQKGAEQTPATTDAEERALLDKILKSDIKPEAAAPEASAKAQDVRARGAGPVLGRTEVLVSPWKALGSFLFVLAVLAGAILGLRRLSVLKGKNGALGRLITKTLGKPARMIDVVATHYLGPKKSIHVVNVAGRTLVLGVSDGSINLITEFAGDVSANSPVVAELKADPKSGPAGDSQSDFLSELGEQIARESGSMGTGAVVAGPVRTQARDQTRERIRSRLEGMKQL